MKKLIAVHMLILASAGQGVLDEVLPGKAFLATPDEVDFLVGRGAARLPTEAEKLLPLAFRAGQDRSELADEDQHSQDVADDTSTAEQVADDTGATDEETTDDLDGSVALDSLTVAQLTEMAVAEGVDLGNTRKKADIITIIENAWAERADVSAEDEMI